MSPIIKPGRWFYVLALVSAAPARGSWDPLRVIHLPYDASENGWRIDWLMNCTHLFAGLLFLVMCGWMAIACLKYTWRHQAWYDHGNSRQAIVIAVVLSVMIFAVVDGNLFFNTLSDLDRVFWNFEVPAKDPRTVKVEINAHQWAWDIRYAGPDGKFGTEDDVVSWNELVVPSGVPIYLQLASTDVIHSFYLPNFRLKQDAVPGQINRLWFQARSAVTGRFDIGCAQHCGAHHYKMKGQLTVVSAREFQSWLASRSDNAKRAYDVADATAHWGWDWKEQ